MLTDVWGLEAEETEIPPEPEHSFVMPEWRAEADRPIYKNESERAYALFLYQNEEFRLALLGYGLFYTSYMLCHCIHQFILLNQFAKVIL